MYSSFENFWKAYIWIMCKVTLVAIQMHQTYVLFLRILSVSMPAPPQQEGKGQHRTRMFVSMLCTTKQHVLNIQLTDMWYLDISSLALTYIYLSRTYDFWHWSTQDELKQAKFYGWHFKKKNRWSQNYLKLFSGYIAPKRWFFGPN